jgi:hypothetical protein
MSYRKEKKFRVSSYEALVAKNNLLLQGMKPLYQARLINSQYFDTLNFQMFDESEEGILPRKKIRVRWYNLESDNLLLEEKTSSIEGRFKISNALSSNHYKKILNAGLISNLYGRVHPSVCINYIREYFLFNNIRITFDKNIQYKFSANHMTFKDDLEVIEIKAPFDCSDDYLESLFPIPNSRFSKYARAFLMRT